MIEQTIHHDLAYMIQKGAAESGVSQGLSFSPSSLTFTLPGNTYLIISALDSGSRLEYKLRFMEEEK